MTNQAARSTDTVRIWAQSNDARLVIENIIAHSKVCYDNCPIRGKFDRVDALHACTTKSEDPLHDVLTRVKAKPAETCSDQLLGRTLHKRLMHGKHGLTELLASFSGADKARLQSKLLALLRDCLTQPELLHRKIKNLNTRDFSKALVADALSQARKCVNADQIRYLELVPSATAQLHVMRRKDDVMARVSNVIRSRIHQKLCLWTESPTLHRKIRQSKCTNRQLVLLARRLVINPADPAHCNEEAFLDALRQE